MLGRRKPTVPDREYTQRAVSLLKTTVWSCFSTRYFSTDHGHYILQGIPHVICYIDDILVTGVDEAEQLHNLEEVLRRLQFHGIRLKKKKCSFLQDSVEFLGHCIDAKGLHTTSEKVEAIPEGLPYCSLGEDG